ncbi:hypothetical protein TVAG_146590 [Trichomonas vaginalis G3]|uniref:LisH domain-containing protein n=1 Tax=Trichomonas vaginalis (strain ATCC PRA-98 / G3) TaxID=412133 RepID=A2DKW3_TRIV3|nr:hypothetical protein TVAGG3_0361570 [Trichomonas vaginalis G3]EAY18916.1 hypothetical protein TVAG_146590 [Trichomonas vaginalis G3]KAI5531977.1 hypothetical protein TVAGG3_0361570 [Trichomonas vaginalis G3]|eukprot:XP_001579902.1 hypothetical protein [Trichomonas vaginalis G3]
MDEKIANAMIQNGSMNKLNSLYISEVAIEGQKSSIGFLKPYKFFKKDKVNKIAAELVMHYLISFEFTNTARCISSESSNSEIFDFDSRATSFSELRLPQTDAPIKSLMAEWLKDVSTPFYDNRDRLSEGIMKRYSELFKESAHSSYYSKTEQKDLPRPPPLQNPPELRMVFPDKSPPKQQIGIIKSNLQQKKSPSSVKPKQEIYQPKNVYQKPEPYTSRKRPDSHYSSILKFSDSDDDWSPPEQILPRKTETKAKANNNNQQAYHYDAKKSGNYDNTISDVFDDIGDF